MTLERLINELNRIVDLNVRNLHGERNVSSASTDFMKMVPSKGVDVDRETAEGEQLFNQFR